MLSTYSIICVTHKLCFAKMQRFNISKRSILSHRYARYDKELFHKFKSKLNKWLSLEEDFCLSLHALCSVTLLINNISYSLRLLIPLLLCFNLETFIPIGVRFSLGLRLSDSGADQFVERHHGDGNHRQHTEEYDYGEHPAWI